MLVRMEHWQLLLELCDRNPELITNKFNGPEGKVKSHALWKTVTSKSNSLGYGEKPMEGWRKALTDWKSETKSKAAAIKREMQKTGGYSNDSPPSHYPSWRTNFWQ
ncbi:unnamed protein product [Ceutorhynchus assimilis]|uniref:Regulatory protein zeste n=1 Tax=Ceutorhynchus assimilis TaxID=467358 RepID=A0A9N9MFZ8_9CUCU|nr:unnamed protein product [Ceutorhynchus assimilis]